MPIFQWKQFADRGDHVTISGQMNLMGCFSLFSFWEVCTVCDVHHVYACSCLCEGTYIWRDVYMFVCLCRPEVDTECLP